MSYILEALKKAESERERGVVPGLGSVPANYATYISYGNSSKPWWLVVLALGVLLALVAGIWAWRQPIPLSTPRTEAAQSTPAPAAPAGSAALRAAHPGKAALPASASSAATLPAKGSSLPGVAQSAPLPASEPAPKSLPSSALRGVPGTAPLLSELPDSLRRQIPPLAISGAIYSDSPAESSLIVNDQVLGKGSLVAPDVRLEDISATSAVFSYKGQRFRLDR